MNLDHRNLQTKECKELCVVLYFKVLYEIACEFTCTGGEVAKIPQHYDRLWADQLFEILTRRQAFGSCVDFHDVAPLLNREIIALFCLADDILMTSSYEFILRNQVEELVTAPKTNANRLLKNRLTTASQKLRRVRCNTFQKLAYGDEVPNSMRLMWRCVFKNHHEILDRELEERCADLITALRTAPIVYEYIPRSPGSRPAVLSRLVKRYRSDIDNCVQKELGSYLGGVFNQVHLEHSYSSHALGVTPRASFVLSTTKMSAG